MKSAILWLSASALLVFWSCNDNKDRSDENRTPIIVEEKYEGKNVPDSVLKTLVPFEEPEKNYLFVEQAVDAWLYFHLQDYRNYEPLIRSTEYNSVSNLYIHHLRLRTMNQEGGLETTERTFQVDLTRQGDHGNPFYVEEIIEIR